MGLLKPLLKDISIGNRILPSLALRFADNTYQLDSGSGLENKVFADIITFTRASGGGRFNSSGVYEFLGNNVPRLDYDPVTLAPRGILIEEQRTNLLTYSGDLTNAAWSRENGTWVNSADSRFGSIGTFTENTATGGRVTGRTISLTAGTTYIHTERLKASGRNVIRMQIFTGVVADFNLSSGTVSNVSGGTASITPVGDGWYDCSVALSVTTTQAYIVRFYPIVAGGATYTGDGRVAFFHAGAQLEAGAFPTSYIPTVASQVTRSADVASVNTLSPWYNATEGTIVVGASTNVTAAISRYVTLVGFARVRVATGAFAFQGVGSPGDLNALSSGVVPTNGLHKIAAAYRANDCVISVDGRVGSVDATSTISAATSLAIGSSGAGTEFMNGHIRNISYYPRAYSGIVLQEMT